MKVGHFICDLRFAKCESGDVVQRNQNLSKFEMSYFYMQFYIEMSCFGVFIYIEMSCFSAYNFVEKSDGTFNEKFMNTMQQMP